MHPWSNDGNESDGESESDGDDGGDGGLSSVPWVDSSHPKNLPHGGRNGVNGCDDGMFLGARGAPHGEVVRGENVRREIVGREGH